MKISTIITSLLLLFCIGCETSLGPDIDECDQDPFRNGPPPQTLNDYDSTSISDSLFINWDECMELWNEPDSCLYIFD